MLKADKGKIKNYNDETFSMSNTIDMERFAGLNFCSFHGFEEYCKSVFMNIYLYLATYVLALYNSFKCKTP